MRIYNSQSTLSFRGKPNSNENSRVKTTPSESAENLYKKLNEIQNDIINLSKSISDKNSQLELIYKETTPEIRTLEAGIKATYENLEKLKKQKNNIQKEINRGSDFSHISKMLEKDKEDILKKEQTALKTLKSATEKLKELREELNLTNKVRVTRLRDEIESSQLRFDELNRQKTNVEKSIQKLSNTEKTKNPISIDTLTGQLSKLKKELNALSNDISNKKQSLESPFIDINQNISALRDDYNSKNAESETELKNKKKELNEVERQKISLKQRIKKFETTQNATELESANGQLKALNSDIKEKENKISIIEQQKSEKDREYKATLRRYNENKNEIYLKYKSEHQKLRDEIRESESKFNIINKQVNSLERMINNLSATEPSKTSRNANKQERLAERTKQKKQKVQAELQRIKQQKELKSQKPIVISRPVYKTETDPTTRLKEIENEINELTNNISAKKLEIAPTLEIIGKEIAKLEAGFKPQKTIFEENISKKETEILEKQKIKSDLESEKLAVQSGLRIQRKEKTPIEPQKRQKHEELKNNIQDINEEIKSLTAEVNTEKAAYKTALDEIEKTKNELYVTYNISTQIQDIKKSESNLSKLKDSKSHIKQIIEKPSVPQTPNSPIEKTIRKNTVAVPKAIIQEQIDTLKNDINKTKNELKLPFKTINQEIKTAKEIYENQAVISRTLVQEKERELKALYTEKNAEENEAKTQASVEISAEIKSKKTELNKLKQDMISAKQKGNKNQIREIRTKITSIDAEVQELNSKKSLAEEKAVKFKTREQEALEEKIDGCKAEIYKNRIQYKDLNSKISKAEYKGETDKVEKYKTDIQEIYNKVKELTQTKILAEQELANYKYDEEVINAESLNKKLITLNSDIERKKSEISELKVQNAIEKDKNNVTLEQLKNEKNNIGLKNESSQTELKEKLKQYEFDLQRLTKQLNSGKTVISKDSQDKVVELIEFEAEDQQPQIDINKLNKHVNETFTNDYNAKINKLLNLGINPYSTSNNDLSSKLIDDYKKELSLLPPPKHLPIPNLKIYKKSSVSRVDISEIPEEIIANRTKKLHIPKSFEISDKNLTLDSYQKQAINFFKEGKTVIVTAPTGTGKTLIAEYGIDDILKSGKKIIYLAPLKALSNEKYNKFGELFGSYNDLGKLIGRENVGLVTGDVKINENAPVTVMTTECYRNMVTSGTEEEIAERLKDVKGVIFDEFHYMGDKDRGTVWEESIMFSPPNVQFMMLSATASNANQIKNWIQTINNQKAVELVNVPESERHVPLKYYTYAIPAKDTRHEKDLNPKLKNTKKKQYSNPQLFNLMDISIDIKQLNKPDTSSRVKEALDAIARKYKPELYEDVPKDKLLINEGLEIIKTEFSDITDKDGKINSEDLIKKLMDKGFKKEKSEQIALTISDDKSKRFNVKTNEIKVPKNPPIKDLIRDLNKENKLPAIFFVFSKKNCKKYMIDASKKMSLTTPEEKALILGKIEECQEQGIFLGTDFETVYKPALLNGYAVHHAGMLPSYKSLVEELFRDKQLKVVFATETLVAGINMPVKTVVITSTTKTTSTGKEEITSSLLKQAAGRAGRRGIDDIGYVVVMPEKRESSSKIFNILTNKSDEINSHLDLSYNFLLSPRVFNNIDNSLNKSFKYQELGNCEELTQLSVQMNNLMKDRGLITQPEGSDKFKITPKGVIASKTRGVNEILLAEVLSDTNLTKDMTPSDLAGLISIFVDNQARNNLTPEYPEELKDLQTKVEQAVTIADSIIKDQQRYNINKLININAELAPFVKEWAEYPEAMNVDYSSWKEIIEKLNTEKIMNQEGDFLKVINSTIDILKQIIEISPDEKLARTADEAITMLKKSPVTDILKHELGEDADESIIMNS